MSPVQGGRPSGFPTSRAYWELKAEQVMNRVFAPEPSIDLEIVETPTPVPASTQAAEQPARRSRRLQSVARQRPPDNTVLLGGGLALMALVLTGSTLVGVGLWSQHQQALQQERNMLLIERLRSLGTSPETATGEPSDAAATGEGPTLPPPPPDEPWMQELAALPSSSAPPARVLQVPINDRVGSPAPPAQGRPAQTAGSTGGDGDGNGLPQLVGVIQIPGRGGSAIFQVGGSSTSAGVGESIGSSGWTLRSASGDAALIERGGVQRRLTISSGF